MYNEIHQMLFNMSCRFLLILAVICPVATSRSMLMGLALVLISSTLVVIASTGIIVVSSIAAYDVTTTTIVVAGLWFLVERVVVAIFPQVIALGMDMATSIGIESMVTLIVMLMRVAIPVLILSPLLLAVATHVLRW